MALPASVTTATSLAFFAMVGFEDSVNMAEETKDPEKVFPKIMLTGLGITGVTYVLVSIVAVGRITSTRDGTNQRGDVSSPGFATVM